MYLTFLPYLLMISLINSCIELEISAPSFPSIAHQLNVSDSLISLTITYNLIGFCLGSLVYGPLSECWGRRKSMLLGNAILTIGAIGCVIAPTIDWLLVSRIIQGIGAATSAVIVSAIIADVYEINKATKLYGIMNAVFTILMALSPVLGGFLATEIGWRGNYGVIAVLCFFSWTSLFFYLPETISSKRHFYFKKTLKNYKTLLSSSLFLSAAAIPSLLYGCYMSFVAIAPFIYMQVFNSDILTYTLHQGIILAVFASTSIFCGKVTASLGAQKTVWIGLGLCSFGSTLMLFGNTPYMLTLTMSVFSIGFALLYPIIFARSLEIWPDIKGTASSAIMGLRYLLCSVITGAAGYFYEGKPIIVAVVICCITSVVFLLISYLLSSYTKSNIER